MSKEVKLEDIVSLCKRRGFIFQGSDIYGGLAGTWDYGPLGLALKNNIMDLWWQTFVDGRDDMYGVDAAILMNQKVWQASGHVDTFTDPLIECGNCHGRFRADHLIENKNEYYKEANLFFPKREAIINSFADKEYTIEVREELFSKLKELDLIVGEATYPAHDSIPELKQFYVSKQQQEAPKFLGDFPAHYLRQHKVKCSRCGEVDWYPARTFNMMFKTAVGPIDDDSSVSYLRPETAQGIFTNYKNVVDTFYPDVPFGIAQQGKAFRNEISPRDFVFRSREFEQMEIEYFVRESEWEAAFEQWRKDIESFLDALGLPKDKVEEVEVPEADRAHYSKRTIDYEYAFPHGKDELLGLAYRTDFDLGNIQRVSGKGMEYRPKDGSEPFVPHVIEPSFGVERAVMAVLTSAYWNDEANERIVLRLPYHLAPVKVAVCPLAKNNDALVAKAREVYDMLRKEFGQVLWIDSGNIGKNYRKMDEIGVPYVVTVDFDTLEGDTKDTVTVRHRDTTDQERVNTTELIAKVL